MKVNIVLQKYSLIQIVWLCILTSFKITCFGGNGGLIASDANSIEYNAIQCINMCMCNNPPLNQCIYLNQTSLFCQSSHNLEFNCENSFFSFHIYKPTHLTIRVLWVLVNRGTEMPSTFILSCKPQEIAN